MLSFSQFLETFVSPPSRPFRITWWCPGFLTLQGGLSVVLVTTCSAKSSSWVVCDGVPFRLGRALSYSLADSAFPECSWPGGGPSEFLSHPSPGSPTLMVCS